MTDKFKSIDYVGDIEDLKQKGSQEDFEEFMKFENSPELLEGWEKGMDDFVETNGDALREIMESEDGLLNSNPILTGKDAERFMDNMLNPEPVDEETRKRIRESFTLMGGDKPRLLGKQCSDCPLKNEKGG